jgi:hypothetical protein
MKKIFVALLQIAVTVAVLFWVFHDPQKRAQMAVALRMADYRWIIAALFCYFFVELAAGIRWWILLKVQQIHLSIPRVAGLFLIGMFYNQFLPGGTGGDIMKSYLLLKETPGKATGALWPSFRSYGQAGRAHYHCWRVDRVALRLVDAAGDEASRLAAGHLQQRRPMLITSFVVSGLHSSQVANGFPVAKAD